MGRAVRPTHRSATAECELGVRRISDRPWQTCAPSCSSRGTVPGSATAAVMSARWGRTAVRAAGGGGAAFGRRGFGARGGLALMQPVRVRPPNSLRRWRIHLSGRRRTNRRHGHAKRERSGREGAAAQGDETRRRRLSAARADPPWPTEPDHRPTVYRDYGRRRERDGQRPGSGRGGTQGRFTPSAADAVRDRVELAWTPGLSPALFENLREPRAMRRAEVRSFAPPQCAAAPRPRARDAAPATTNDAPSPGILALARALARLQLALETQGSPESNSEPF